MGSIIEALPELDGEYYIDNNGDVLRRLFGGIRYKKDNGVTIDLTLCINEEGEPLAIETVLFNSFFNSEESPQYNLFEYPHR